MAEEADRRGDRAPSRGHRWFILISSCFHFVFILAAHFSKSRIRKIYFPIPKLALETDDIIIKNVFFELKFYWAF